VLDTGESSLFELDSRIRGNDGLEKKSKEVFKTLHYSFFNHFPKHVKEKEEFFTFSGKTISYFKEILSTSSSGLEPDSKEKL
jgi:hypothetical protein